MEYSVMVITEVKVNVNRKLGLASQKRLGEMIQGRVERSRHRKTIRASKHKKEEKCW